MLPRKRYIEDRKPIHHELKGDYHGNEGSKTAENGKARKKSFPEEDNSQERRGIFLFCLRAQGNCR
jgi:hypothetical protein